MTNEEKMEYLAQEIQLLTGLFPEFEFFGAISFNRQQYKFFGNGCHPCTIGAATNWMIDTNIQHKEEQMREVNKEMN